jgi:hypothetical protein
MAGFDTTDYGWFNKGPGSSSGSGGFPDYSGAFKPDSPIQADTWKTGFGVGADKGKSFLDAFVKGLQGTGQDKYQQQAQQGGFQTGGKGETPGANIGKIAPDLSIYTPPTPYSPFTVAGVQGKKGMGGALGGLAGTALGFALAPLTGGTSLALTAAEGAALGGGLGSGIGGMFD